MKIPEGERLALHEVLAYGETYGYGNLITHLQTAWARHLMRSGISETVARRSTARDGSGYPFLMQDDLLERGEWDETGRRYSSDPPPANAVDPHAQPSGTPGPRVKTSSSLSRRRRQVRR